jgi:hypothetical protein
MMQRIRFHMDAAGNDTLVRLETRFGDREFFFQDAAYRFGCKAADKFKFFNKVGRFSGERARPSYFAVRILLEVCQVAEALLPLTWSMQHMVTLDRKLFFGWVLTSLVCFE